MPNAEWRVGRKAQCEAHSTKRSGEYAQSPKPKAKAKVCGLRLEADLSVAE